MSGYPVRRAPNVSQYIANLNQIPAPQDISPAADINIDDGIDFLTNAEFFDFDQFNPPLFDPQQPPQSATEQQNGQQYGYGDYHSYPATAMTPPDAGILGQPALQGAYPSQPSPFQPGTGEKRKAPDSAASTADIEESSRMAAEEDKRRRNTAASARFRIKKKQREQALEKQAKDMSDRVQQLEGRVQELEMENKWLKELITDKSDAKTLGASLLSKSEKESEERSSGNRTDGVGTPKAKEAKVEA